jgi:uncharacterized repeat protein (TIGR03806 family)
VAYQYRSTAPVSVAESSRAVFFAAALLACGCSSDTAPAAPSGDGGGGSSGSKGDARAADSGSGVTPAPEGEPYSTLDEWHLFEDAVKQSPGVRVVPYEVVSQLYADYTTKRRFIYVPEGKKVGYSATEKWAMPVGTILVKTFAYPADTRDPSKGERLLETRLLIHEASGWVPHTYVWDAAQKSATLKVGGDVIDSQFIDPSGKDRTNGYIVPSENDCRGCHGRLGETDTLGGRTRQLDRDNDYGSGPENQIDHMARLGFFDSAPEPAASRVHLVDPFGSASLSERARSYMDGNCAHCHVPGTAQGSSSGLWLDWDSTGPTAAKNHWGYCKDRPSAAGGGTCGLLFDIVPGRPDESILICRVNSTLTKEKMPTVGRNLVHTEGVALLRDWIASIPGSCGNPPQTDAGVEAGAPDGAPSDSGSPGDGSKSDG